MRRILAFLAVAACLPAPFTASAAAPPAHLADPAQRGRARHAVLPEYPPLALAAGRTGHVDISGRVNALGQLEQVAYSPDSPPSGVFIDPIRRAIRAWSFVPPLDVFCRPSNARVANRVSFAIEGGKPRITVAHLPSGAAAPAAALLSPLHREEPVYPAALRASGVEAVVYARMQLDATGAVVSVEPRVHPTQGRRAMRELEHEAIRALTQWRFPPAADAAAIRHVCHDLRFGPP